MLQFSECRRVPGSYANWGYVRGRAKGIQPTRAEWAWNKFRSRPQGSTTSAPRLLKASFWLLSSRAQESCLHDLHSQWDLVTD